MDTVLARQQMVDQQIRTWEVLDPRVLDVLSAVPREAFVPPAYRELAFADTPIPIGFGQSMLAPVLQGRILQSLAVIGSDTVLEVGTGTGYLTAAFGLLAGSIRSISGPNSRRRPRRTCERFRRPAWNSRREMRSTALLWANTTSSPSPVRC